MTSQLNVDTIVDKAGSGGSNVKMANTSTYVGEGGGSTQNTVQGLIKSWVLASNAASPTDSFNVSGGTDNGTGHYTYAFSTNMGNTNYSVAAGTAGGSTFFGFNLSGSSATGNHTNKIATDGGSLTDDINISHVAGDLA
jgi:hypothetical protein